MATLDEILERFPDNSEGAIDADDLRFAVTEIWNYVVEVQATQHEIVVTIVPALQEEIRTIKTRLDALEGQ